MSQLYWLMWRWSLMWTGLCSLQGVEWQWVPPLSQLLATHLPHHGHTPLTSNTVGVCIPSAPFLQGLSLLVMFWAYLDTSGSSPELEILNLIILLNKATSTGPDISSFAHWEDQSIWLTVAKRKGNGDSRSLAPASGVWFTCWHGIPCESCPEIKTWIYTEDLASLLGERCPKVLNLRLCSWDWMLWNWLDAKVCFS